MTTKHASMRSTAMKLLWRLVPSCVIAMVIPHIVIANAFPRAGLKEVGQGFYVGHGFGMTVSCCSAFSGIDPALMNALKENPSLASGGLAIEGKSGGDRDCPNYPHVLQIEAGWPVPSVTWMVDMNEVGRRRPALGCFALGSPTYLGLEDRFGEKSSVTAAYITRFPVSFRFHPLPTAATALAVLVMICILEGGTRLLIGHVRRRQGKCPSCGYSQKGLPEGTICPECGRAPSRNRPDHGRPEV